MEGMMDELKRRVEGPRGRGSWNIEHSIVLKHGRLASQIFVCDAYRTRAWVHYISFCVSPVELRSFEMEDEHYKKQGPFIFLHIAIQT